MGDMPKTKTPPFFERLLAPLIDQLLHARLAPIREEFDIIGREIVELNRRIGDLESSVDGN
jgi:hypothetical protein